MQKDFKMREKILAVFSTIPFFIIFIAFQIAPLIWIIINSFQAEDVDGFTLENYRYILNSKFFSQAFYLSMQISIASSTIALCIALIGSYSLYKMAPSKITSFILSFNTMTSNFSGVPLAFAFIIVLGTNGVFNLLLKEIGIEATIDIYSIFGVNIVYVYFQIPLAILLLYPAFDSLDQNQESASRILGAKKWIYWQKIALPILTPALIGVFVILIANALGAYATIYAMTSGNFNVLPIRIASLISGDVTLDPYLASAVAVFLIVLMIFIVLLSNFISKKYDFKANK